MYYLLAILVKVEIRLRNFKERMQMMEMHPRRHL